MLIDDQLDSLAAIRKARLLDRDPLHLYMDGVSAGGRRWFNLTPRSFLEAGAAGAFGGWEPEDEKATGRGFVPGLVMTPHGPMRPEDIPRPVRIVVTIGWQDVRKFLERGHRYE